MINKRDIPIKYFLIQAIIKGDMPDMTFVVEAYDIEDARKIGTDIVKNTMIDEFNKAWSNKMVVKEVTPESLIAVLLKN